jgi:hypothetical protein
MRRTCVVAAVLVALAGFDSKTPTVATVSTTGGVTSVGIGLATHYAGLTGARRTL